VDSVVETVDFAMGRKPASPSSRGKTATRRPEHTKFIAFVTNVLTRAEVTTPTLLAALVYIDRAKPHLHIGLEQWALERVFLGSIIVASKVCFSSLIYSPLY
jgi:Cyclin, N-terminal domain